MFRFYLPSPDVCLSVLAEESERAHSLASLCALQCYVGTAQPLQLRDLDGELYA